MPLKHTTIPSGVDQAGFTGVTPSIWGQAHTFSGGTNGAAVIYNTGNSDNLGYAASVAGLFFSTGTNVLPTFSSTINIALTFSSTITFGAPFTSTATGSYIIGAGGAGANSSLGINGASGTAGGGFLFWEKNGAISGHLGPTSAITGAGTSSNTALEAASGNGIDFFTNGGGGGSPRWGINSAGDFTFGASSHIVDSSGVPTVQSGFGGISSGVTGTDYAFLINEAGSASTGGTIAFGHTWSTAPVCIPMGTSTTQAPFSIASTQTTVTITHASTTSFSIYVLCRGF